jgi:Tn3 transposase DDE domain
MRFESILYLDDMRVSTLSDVELRADELHNIAVLRNACLPYGCASAHRTFREGVAGRNGSLRWEAEGGRAAEDREDRVLDGLLYHESNLRIEEHYTDTAGFTDHVFAFCHLLGFRFAPRIPNLP